MRASARLARTVETDRDPLSPQPAPRARGPISNVAGQAALARRRHHPATGAGAARRPGQPRRRRYRADAAAIRRPRHRRRRRRPAGRRTARLRRRMAADGERHRQSAAHPRQRAQARATHRRRAHRHHPRAERRRRLERDRGHRTHAGVPGHLVSRPAARRNSWPGTADRRLAGARRPRDRAVELRVAGDDRALQHRARAHHRDPARGRYRNVQPRGDQCRARRRAAPRLGRFAAACASCWCPAASRRGTGRW